MKEGSLKLSGNQIAIIVLTLATALIHFTLLFPDPMFIMNALGYLTLLVAYFLPVALFRKYHALIRWLYIAFALVTIVAWLLIGDKSWPGGALGYVTKTIEVLLVFFLWSDRRA